MRILAIIPALFFSTVPLKASAADPIFTDAPGSFAELAGMIVTFLNVATGVLMTLGIVVYFWGMSVNIVKFEDDPTRRKAYFVWGLVVFFVMMSIWGIVMLIQRTLFMS